MLSRMGVVGELASHKVVVVEVIFAEKFRRIVGPQTNDIVFHGIPSVFFGCSAVATHRRIGPQGSSAKRTFVVAIWYRHGQTLKSGRAVKASRLSRQCLPIVEVRNEVRLYAVVCYSATSSSFSVAKLFQPLPNHIRAF